MQNYVGRINLSRLINARDMEVEYEGKLERGIFIPFEDNNISTYRGNHYLRLFIAYNINQNKWKTHSITYFTTPEYIEKLHELGRNFPPVFGDLGKTNMQTPLQKWIMIHNENDKNKKVYINPKSDK